MGWDQGYCFNFPIKFSVIVFYNLNVLENC